MQQAVYDAHTRYYVDFVDNALRDPDSVWHVLMARYCSILGDALDGARVLDIACGEGYLARFLVRQGPRSRSVVLK